MTTGGGGTEASPVSEAAVFEDGPCPLEVPGGYDVSCGTLYVPENRSVAAGREIGLAVAVVRPPGEVTGPPVVYLAGGPGGSALNDFEVDPASWDYPFLAGRELVLLDQRGTGYSDPTLNCPELETTDATPGEATRACFDRLVAEGVDLAAYTTQENAADVAALRTALGVTEWDLLGVSYGTRLALEVMDRHPAGIRSVVLDSPFPRSADVAVDEALVVMWSLERLEGDCAADAYCAENYPDLIDTLVGVVADLNADPGEISGDELMLGLFNAFQDPGLIPLIPWAIHEVADGNLDAAFEIVGDGAARRQAGEDVSDSEGMYQSVICADEYALGDYERAEAAVVGQVPPEFESALLEGTFSNTTTCEYWNPRQTTDNSSVVSDIPALILVGQYDTATPPEWAGATAEGLVNSFLVVFPGMGHSVVTESCPISITTDFLADPSAPPDLSCVDALEWPYFE
jgi:pimeloyl-ACP methyl ester carboxylesterase